MSISFSNLIQSGGYVLPAASASILGGVKVGTGLSVDGNGSITTTDTLLSITSRGATTSTAVSLTGGLTVGTSLSIPSGDTNSRPSAVAGNLRFNTTLGKFEGYSGSAWGAIGGSSLTPTTIKTSGYTAVAGDLVRCNTTAGSFNVTFPSDPIDGDVIGVVDVSNYFASNAIFILSNGKNIESDATSLVLDINGASVAFVYSSATSNWKLIQSSISTNVSVSGGYSLPTASASTLGGIKIGTGLSIDGNGIVTTTGGGFEQSFLLMGA